MSEVDISDLVTQYAGNCTVGFVDFQRGTPRPYGSGTLVSFGLLKGILTCAHVADAISKRSEVGIVAFCRGSRRPQGLKIKVAECHMTILDGTNPIEGPDLAFVLLPSETVEHLSAYATFANGEKQRRDVQQPEPSCDEAFATVVGGVAEWTSTSETPERATTTFGGLSNIGAFKKVATGAPDFDFLEFSAHPERNFKMPDSYHGVSGGGLWKFYLKSVADGFDVVQARLVGVAFYQTETGTILCHGPRSVYHQLYWRLPGISEVRA